MLLALPVAPGGVGVGEPLPLPAALADVPLPVREGGEVGSVVRHVPAEVREVLLQGRGDAVETPNPHKLWSVVDERDDEEAARDGFKIRAPEVIETMRRLQAQSALALSILDSRTVEGKWWSLVNAMAADVVSAGEIMVNEVAPAPVPIGSE